MPAGVVNVIPCRWLWLSSTSSSLSSFFVQCLSQTHSNIIFIFASVWHQTMNFENYQSYQLFIHSWKSLENRFSFETQPREGGRGWEKDVPGANWTNDHGQNNVSGKKFFIWSICQVPIAQTIMVKILCQAKSFWDLIWSYFQDSRVSIVSFTGSCAVGKKVFHSFRWIIYEMCINKVRSSVISCNIVLFSDVFGNSLWNCAISYDIAHKPWKNLHHHHHYQRHRLN